MTNPCLKTTQVKAKAGATTAPQRAARRHAPCGEHRLEVDAERLLGLAVHQLVLDFGHPMPSFLAGCNPAVAHNVRHGAHASQELLGASNAVGHQVCGAFVLLQFNTSQRLYGGFPRVRVMALQRRTKCVPVRETNGCSVHARCNKHPPWHQSRRCAPPQNQHHQHRRLLCRLYCPFQRDHGAWHGVWKRGQLKGFQILRQKLALELALELVLRPQQ